MDILQELRNEIFRISNNADFERVALQMFKLHYQRNSIYKTYVDLLKRSNIQFFTDIPFLPIDFFKTQKIILDNKNTSYFFASSGTTGSQTSKHFISDFSIYEESFLKGFEYFFGKPSEYCFLALLPNYLEQGNSSLIYMIKALIEKSNHPESGFYLNEYDLLRENLNRLKSENKKVILFGVTYALLDLTENCSMKLENTMVFETGGMKGRRKEIVREELHNVLCDRFGISEIYSEYGMTELFSQAYSKGHGLFECPPWMKIIIRDVNDPLSIANSEKTGGINVIDLANIYSCPFIATQDLGKVNKNGMFEVLGRFDQSDIRGCNLLFTS